MGLPGTMEAGGRLAEVVERKAATEGAGGSGVLLVEEHALIALDVEEMLRELGFGPIFVATRPEAVETALLLGAPGFAVVDPVFGGRLDAALLDRICARVGAVVVTCGPRIGAGLPGRAGVMALAKPFDARGLARALARADERR